jgi:hypothetical protein
MQPSAAAPQASDRIWCKRATPTPTAIRSSSWLPRAEHRNFMLREALIGILECGKSGGILVESRVQRFQKLRARKSRQQ